jgi:hypothetical protein
MASERRFPSPAWTARASHSGAATTESGVEKVASQHPTARAANPIGARGNRMMVSSMSQIPRYQLVLVMLPTSSRAWGIAATAMQKTTRRASLRITCRKDGRLKAARLAAATV